MTEDIIREYFSLRDRNILVTGASSGIGRECAIVLSRLGARLVLVGRNLPRLEAARKALSGDAHLIIPQDITEYDKLEALVSASVERLGRISGFVHSAGMEKTLPMRSMRAGVYEKLFSINVISGLELARIISKNKYSEAIGGSFVFLASVMGFLGQPGKIGYCASKGALIPAAKAMALELAGKRIRVNCILPGVVETELTEAMFAGLPVEARSVIENRHPLGFGKVRDVALACAYLLSDAARWVTGSCLTIDGGYTAE